MFRHLVLPAALAVAALPALAGEIKVRDIDVVADLSAVESADALGYWPNLAADLRAELATALKEETAEKGHDLKVTVEEISLDGSPILGAAGEFNRLRGTVSIYEGDEIVGAFPLAVRAEVSPTAVLTPGTILLLPTERNFYQAMLAGFAALADERLDMVPLRDVSNSEDG